MEWLAQALAQQQSRQNQYLTRRALEEKAAAGEIALDDPRMAGINPGLDAFLAQAAMESGTEDQYPKQAPQPAQSLVGNPRAPMSNLIYNGLNSIGNALTGWTVPPGYEEAMTNLGMIGQASDPVAQLGNKVQMPPSPTSNQQLPPTPEALLQQVAQAQAPVAQPQATMPAVQQAPQPMQSNQSIIAELERAARPMPEALPAGYSQTLAQVLGNEQSDANPQSPQRGQSGITGKPGQATPENTFLGMLGDPSISRFLLGMGSALSQGVPFAAAVKSGVDERDRVLAIQADAPYKNRKREIDLNKTVADTVKSIAEAGQAEQLGVKANADANKSKAEAGKIRVETPLTGYNAQTERLKAQASQLSAQAAYKQSEAALKNAFSTAGGKDKVMTDKDRMTLVSSSLEAINENIILKNQLQEQGIDPLEFVTYAANTSASNPENLRYIPLDPSKAASLQQDFQRLRSLPDTPETQAEVKAFEDRVTKYKMIYGKEALLPLFRSQQ